jgi:hypothetical protein
MDDVSLNDKEAILIDQDDSNNVSLLYYILLLYIDTVLLLHYHRIWTSTALTRRM